MAQVSPRLHCLRIVYLNGDIEVRHNVSELAFDLDNAGSYFQQGGQTYNIYQPVRSIFVTPQDTLRSHL